MRLALPVILASCLAAASAVPAVADDAAAPPLIDRGLGPGLLLLSGGGLDASSAITLEKTDLSSGSSRMTFTREGMVIGADVGVTDRLQVGAGYQAVLRDDTGMSLDDRGWEGTATVRAAFLALSRPELQVAITGQLADDLPSGQTTTALGLAVQRRLSSRLALYTPGGQIVAGPLGDAVTLSLPIGAALQPARSLYVFADTELARIALAHATDSYWLADALPVTAGAFLATGRRVDFGLVVHDDLEAARSYTALAVARLYGL